MFTNGLPGVEPVAVPDVYISGVACVEPLGNGMYRITHYAVQHVHGIQQDCAVIVSRLIASIDTMRAGRDYIFSEVDKPRLVASN